jgi:hypothetical protein
VPEAAGCARRRPFGGYDTPAPYHAAVQAAPQTSLVPRLLAIGGVAGVFSSLFGVGGGIVVVPLLLALTPFPPRTAAATSLGAIAITAATGASLYAVQGDIHVWYAVLLGVPAAIGAALGTAFQQQLSGRALVLSFAVLLVAIAVWLIAG